MKAIEILIQVPCFKCLYIEPIMESHLHCNPRQCEKLTEWLFKQVEDDEKARRKIVLMVADVDIQESP